MHTARKNTNQRRRNVQKNRKYPYSFSTRFPCSFSSPPSYQSSSPPVSYSKSTSVATCISSSVFIPCFIFRKCRAPQFEACIILAVMIASLIFDYQIIWRHKSWTVFLVYALWAKILKKIEKTSIFRF